MESGAGNGRSPFSKWLFSPSGSPDIDYPVGPLDAVNGEGQDHNYPAADDYGYHGTANPESDAYDEMGGYTGMEGEQVAPDNSDQLPLAPNVNLNLIDPAVENYGYHGSANPQPQSGPVHSLGYDGISDETGGHAGMDGEQVAPSNSDQSPLAPNVNQVANGENESFTPDIWTVLNLGDKDPKAPKQHDGQGAAQLRRRLEDLPLKRIPVWKPRARFDAKNYANVPAYLMQATGDEAVVVCDSCRDGKGKWEGCIVPFDMAVLGATGGCCANCHYQNEGSRKCKEHYIKKSNTAKRQPVWGGIPRRGEWNVDSRDTAGRKWLTPQQKTPAGIWLCRQNFDDVPDAGDWKLTQNMIVLLGVLQARQGITWEDTCLLLANAHKSDDFGGIGDYTRGRGPLAVTTALFHAQETMFV